MHHSFFCQGLSSFFSRTAKLAREATLPGGRGTTVGRGGTETVLAWSRAGTQALLAIAATPSLLPLVWFTFPSRSCRPQIVYGITLRLCLVHPGYSYCRQQSHPASHHQRATALLTSSSPPLVMSCCSKAVLQLVVSLRQIRHIVASSGTAHSSSWQSPSGNGQLLVSRSQHQLLLC